MFLGIGISTRKLTVLITIARHTATKPVDPRHDMKLQCPLSKARCLRQLAEPSPRLVLCSLSRVLGGAVSLPEVGRFSLEAGQRSDERRKCCHLASPCDLQDAEISLFRQLIGKVRVGGAIITSFRCFCVARPQQNNYKSTVKRRDESKPTGRPSKETRQGNRVDGWRLINHECGHPSKCGSIVN